MKEAGKVRGGKVEDVMGSISEEVRRREVEIEESEVGEGKISRKSVGRGSR